MLGIVLVEARAWGDDEHHDVMHHGRSADPGLRQRVIAVDELPGADVESTLM